jgi:predicted GNAT family acetyltransferase
MSPSKSLQFPHVPDRLRNILSHEFGDDPLAPDLFDEFLPRRAYSRSFALKLIDVAKRSAGASWEIRRLAALMLENQVLKLSPDDVEEFDLLLVQLGVKTSPGKGSGIDDSVLKEGYTTTHLCRFVLEFRRRLERHRWVHERLAGGRTSQSAMRDFISLSKCDCKITVARYLFKPEEVVERIVGQLRKTRGVPDLDHRPPSYMKDAAAHTLELLPRYEATILRGLCQSSVIYWVADATRSEINSLVEYPLTTVVLVIKPPGSPLEFEIKRAGRRRNPALSVVYERNGYTVPPPHRLDGGSMLTFLRHEARHSSLFSTIYRRVHASDAPMSMIVSRSSIFGVPARGGEENILEYLTNPRLFGDGFGDMREALKDCVYAFNKQDSSNAIRVPGDFGLAVQFLNHTTPGQAILTGTSAFRLSKVAAYLSDQGPDIYFKQGLRVDYSRRDARWLADSLLEEVLGLYSPPAVAYRNQVQYVAAAFAVAENRARADRIFLDSVRQIGTFWGTLLATRGYSWGESFVPRNVGLKSFWADGCWQVKIIFMDHDCLNVVEKPEKDFHSPHIYNGVATDARFIGGGLIYTREQQTAIYFLKLIYRVRGNVGDEGVALLYKAIRKAYRATQEAMLTDPEVGKLFDRVFLERLRDWDTVVGSYLKMKSDGSDVDAWKAEVRRSLKGKGYSRGLIEEHLKTIEAHSDFLERQAFLY